MTEPAGGTRARGAVEQGCVETRVRYPETDRMGVAHHSHYLVWFELGRTEWMRDLGCPYGRLEDRDSLYFPVVEVGARYRRPARYDDVLAIRTRVVAVSGATVRFDYRVEDRDSRHLVATGYTIHAAVGADGRPRRVPDALADKMRATIRADADRETTD